MSFGICFGMCVRVYVCLHVCLFVEIDMEVDRNTGWPASPGPFRLSKLGMALRFGLLFGRNGPLWEVWGIEISTRDRRGTLISISFLNLSPPFFGVKNI